MTEENKPQENFANVELTEAELDEVAGGTKDKLTSLNTGDMQRLQQMMEQKSQLETMISNTMKAAGESQSGVTGSLKAS